MARIFSGVLTLTVALALAACSAGPSQGENSSTPGAVTSSAPPPTTTGAGEMPSADTTAIKITIDDTVISATLNGSDAAQDLVAALPLTVPSIRNIDIEYFGAVKSPLTETGPFYDDVKPGHIVYYAPKDEVALIFEPTSSPGQLTHIGDITSELSIFDGLPDDANISYKLADS